MIRLAIIDEKGETVEPEELTDTALGQIMFECDRIKEQCEELHNAIQDENP